MSRIVKPGGRPVAQATLTLDHHGQMQISAVRIDRAGKPVPMSLVEALALLSNAVTSTLAGMAGNAVQAAPLREDRDNGTAEQQQS